MKSTRFFPTCGHPLHDPICWRLFPQQGRSYLGLRRSRKYRIASPVAVILAKRMVAAWEYTNMQDNDGADYPYARDLEVMAVGPSAKILDTWLSSLGPIIAGGISINFGAGDQQCSEES